MFKATNVSQLYTLQQVTYYGVVWINQYNDLVERMKCEGFYLPMQNLEKILFSNSSWYTRPVAVPKTSSPSRK